MACTRPADDIKSMPPPWPGSGPQQSGVYMESSNATAVGAVDENLGAASSAGSNAHYNQPATRTNRVRGTLSRSNSTTSSYSSPEGGLVPREVHLGVGLTEKMELGPSKYGMGVWMRFPASIGNSIGVLTGLRLTKSGIESVILAGSSFFGCQRPKPDFRPSWLLSEAREFSRI